MNILKKKQPQTKIWLNLDFLIDLKKYNTGSLVLFEWKSFASSNHFKIFGNISHANNKSHYMSNFVTVS